MATHWKKLSNPEYIGAYAFEPGEEKTATIASVREESVIGADGKREECIVAHFQEKDLKPMILNATNCKAITKLYKTPYIEDWAGKRIVLRVQQVKAFGEVVDAIRIKPEIPQVKKLACDSCGKALTPYGTMSAEQLAAYTRQQYRKCLCAECAAKEKAKLAEQQNAQKEE